jgi:hypothetical protein
LKGLLLGIDDAKTVATFWHKSQTNFGDHHVWQGSAWKKEREESSQGVLATTSIYVL